MRFRPRAFRDEPEINFIPLIDVLLVILIFLMVTTTYSRYAELQINLPSADAESPPDHPNRIDVSVDAQGNYAVNRVVTPFADPAAFGDALRRAAAGIKEPIVVISADAKAPHQSVINVMEAARIAGYGRITFTTQSAKR